MRYCPKKGFIFGINEKGLALCDAMESKYAMESEYAMDYTAAALKATKYAKNHSLESLLSTINRKALDFHRRGNT